MLGPVTIRQHSKEFFQLLKSEILLSPGENSSQDKLNLFLWIEIIDQKTEINIVELLNWLNHNVRLENDDSQFLLESLRASFLEDLYYSIPEHIKFHKNDEPQSNYELFRFLTIAGMIVAICEGFDGIVSILGLFPFVPAAPIFIAGIIFAALSVIVFRGFDLIAMAKNLGVEMEAPHGVDVFLEQVDQIAKLRAVISLCCTEDSHEQDHATLKQLSMMLSTRYQALDEVRDRYKEDLNSPYLRTAKSLTSAIAGVMFFGSGFFSGQSVFLAIASIFTTSVSALFWPILAASFVVGVAALSIYWFVERPGLESLVSRWLDIDEDKINAMVDDQLVMEQKRDLHQLARQVEQVERLHQQTTRFIPSNVSRIPVPEQSIAGNDLGFFNPPRARSKSVGALDRIVAPDASSFFMAMV